jgi:hypothetical protein
MNSTTLPGTTLWAWDESLWVVTVYSDYDTSSILKPLSQFALGQLSFDRFPQPWFSCLACGDRFASCQATQMAHC